MFSIWFDRLDDSEVQGDELADFLASLMAEIKIIDGSDLLYQEFEFPIVELAFQLHRWALDSDRLDFEFDSMSFEEVGVVSFRSRFGRWIFTSCLNNVKSRWLLWSELTTSLHEFHSHVERELVRLGIDPCAIFPT